MTPIRLRTVAAAVFTRPEIAAVGVPQSKIDDGNVPARTLMLPLNTNARAKMSLLRLGFVKIFCRPATGVVIGGVVVAPIASELILPIALAVQNGNVGRRPGADAVGVPVAVGFDRRGGAKADGARRSGLTST